MKYQKIHTLWKREKIGNKKGPIIEGEYSREEFEEIEKWEVTEKINGTNIRIMFDGENVEFDGRNENAEIPAQLCLELYDISIPERMTEIFGDEQIDVTLFGEGYGPNIEGGGTYSDKQKFILFDVKIGKWWLKRDAVDNIAEELDIKSVPCIGCMDTESIVEFVKTKPASRIPGSNKMMEGVVCRPKSGLLFRDGTPLMWKLKCNDYK